MKPRIVKCEYGERQWAVHWYNSITYFRTYEDALAYAKKVCNT